MKEIDSKQIDAWKKAHGDVFKVEVDGKVCYLKKPEETRPQGAGSRFRSRKERPDEVQRSPAGELLAGWR